MTIINKCIRGDRSAQNELYKQYYSYGLGICMRYIDDQLEARTILNEGFYKVFKNIKTYNQEYDFKPWFKTIMVHCALDYLRKNNKLSSISSLEQGSNISIESAAISNMAFDEMLLIINELPAAYKAVFNMYVIDGFKHVEIAKKLGISVGTSKSNLSRAKEKLRSMFKINLVA